MPRLGSAFVDYLIPAPEWGTKSFRLDRALERQLATLAKRLGRSRSDIARDALRRQLAILQFEEARRSIMPFAEARGYLTDNDVFRDVS
ncbi:MAG TPA: ribbon-helix-helix protein, CopG family [Gemmatimonadaceae bacterium]